MNIFKHQEIWKKILELAAGEPAEARARREDRGEACVLPGRPLAAEQARGMPESVMVVCDEPEDGCGGIDRGREVSVAWRDGVHGRVYGSEWGVVLGLGGLHGIAEVKMGLPERGCGGSGAISHGG